jgi:methionyl-tRNA formyltransferase
MKQKIALLISDDFHHQYLASLMTLNFDVVAVIVEPRENQVKRLLKKKRYIDYFYSVYHHLRREIFGLNSYRRQYFCERGSVIASNCQVVVVDWINDPCTIDVLRKSNPDLTVVMGTSILHKKTLQVSGEKILNIHGGYLPDYRGNHCFFFPIYNKEFDKIGSTIHFVDVGIDTGDIIDIIIPPIEVSDFKSSLSVAEVLYCRAEMLAIDRLIDLLRNHQDGHPLPRLSQSKKGNLYKTRDRKIYHDVILLFRQFRGKLIPN